ncbi:hypothetical protein Ancab_019381 [Ancistrocladus abbreviatus]
MIGAIASGRIADHFGRKGALGMSTFSSIVGWIAIYFSKGCISLDIGRLLSGYGIGVFSYVPIYIAEIAPKNLRGGLAALNQLMIVIGATTAVMLGTVITWRQLALTVQKAMAIMNISFTVEEGTKRKKWRRARWRETWREESNRVELMENPLTTKSWWLIADLQVAKVGKQKECESSLRILRGKDVDISNEAAEIQKYIQSLKQIPKAGILDLLQPRYSLSLVHLVGEAHVQNSNRMLVLIDGQDPSKLEPSLEGCLTDASLALGMVSAYFEMDDWQFGLFYLNLADLASPDVPA